QRQQLFDKIVSLVETKYYDRTFAGHNWQQLAAAHRDRILAAQDPIQFEEKIMELLGELGGGHLGLLSPRTKITPRSSINASFRRINTNQLGNRWVFQDVLPGGVAERAEVKSGDVLVALDRREVDASVAPAFPMNVRTPITVDRNGSQHDLHLDLTTQRPKYRDNPYSEPDSAVASVLDNVGVLKVGLFPGRIGIDFANRISHVFDGSFRVVHRLLIDLRGNPGGGIGGLRIMSYLSPSSLPVGFSIDRKTADRGYDKEHLPRLNHIPRSKWEIPLLALKFFNKKSVVLQTEGLGTQPFHGRVGILVNEHSTSAAEMLAQFAKENTLATIIGTKTPGRLTSRSAFKIGNDYRLVLPVAAYQSWKGIRIEGKGIEPDVVVDWSFDAALTGHDSQLAHALQVVSDL
ncbi:MAG: S41 family peptidase, partial [Candidatus Sulfotelmatobacter sp.]